MRRRQIGLRPSLPADSLNYDGNVDVHWIESHIGAGGELVLHNLPFSPGQAVEVIVLPKQQTPGLPTAALLGSVLEYQHPLEPVAADDWDALP